MLQFETLGVVSDDKVFKKSQKNGNFYAKQVFDIIDIVYGCKPKN